MLTEEDATLTAALLDRPTMPTLYTSKELMSSRTDAIA